jgi:hypothetical protein
MSKRTFSYVVDDSNAHVDSKSPFGFSSNKFAAHRNIDHIQMDLLMVFGFGFCIAMVVLYCYWIFLNRAKLFDRASDLREQLVSNSNAPSTPRQTEEKSRMPFLSPFHHVSVKAES